MAQFPNKKWLDETEVDGHRSGRMESQYKTESIELAITDPCLSNTVSSNIFFL